MEKKFIIVVDVQNDFAKEDGKLYVPGAQELIPAQNEHISRLFHANVEGILYTFDTHTEEEYPNSPEGEQFPPHCYKGTPGWELAVSSSTVPRPIPRYRLEKGVFNMWEEEDVQIKAIGNDLHYVDLQPTDRDTFFELLKEKGVTTVEVWGLASDFCVKWAVDGLLERGFNVEIRKDLVKGIERQIDQVLEEEWQGKNVQLV